MILWHIHCFVNDICVKWLNRFLSKKLNFADIAFLNHKFCNNIRLIIII